LCEEEEDGRSGGKEIGIRIRIKIRIRPCGQYVGKLRIKIATHPPDLRVVQVLRKSQVIRIGGSLTVRSAAMFTPD